MLGADIFILELRRFGCRLVEYFIEPAPQIHLACSRALNARLFFQIIIQLLFHLLRGCIQFAQNGTGDAVFLPQETNEKMLRLDRLVSQRARQRLRVLKRFLNL